MEIVVKELVPVVIAAAIRGASWTGCCILFHIDNLAMVTVVQKLNARDPLLGNLLRCLFFMRPTSILLLQPPTFLAFKTQLLMPYRMAIYLCLRPCSLRYPEW